MKSSSKFLYMFSQLINLTIGEIESIEASTEVVQGNKLHHDRAKYIAALSLHGNLTNSNP